MQLSELQTQVNQRRRDDTEGFISPDEIKGYLNEGLRKAQAAREWSWARTSANLSFTEGSFKYALSSVGADFREPIGVLFDSYDLDKVNYNDFFRLSGGGQNMFAIDGESIYIDTTFGSCTFNIPYYSNYTAKTSAGEWIARLSSDTDEPLMPERFQDIPVEYADARCQRKEGNLDDYNIAINDYNNYIALMKREYPSERKLQTRRWRHINETGVSQPLDWKENPIRQ